MSITFSRPSVRNLLALLFFLLTAIPVEIIGVLLTNRAWDRELQMVHEQHLQVACRLAEALTRYAEDVEATFQLMASNMAQQRPAPELATVLERLHFKHVSIVNSAGQVERLLSPSVDVKPEHLPAALLEQLHSAGTAAVPAVRFSNVLPDHHGEPTIFLWQPLGEARYALGALKTEYFVKLQSAIRIGQKGHAVILDYNGHIIAHPDPQWRAMMKDMSQIEPVRRIMAGETGVLRFSVPEVPDDLVAGFTMTPKTGWGVMIPQPVSELEARVDQVNRAVWSVICVALLVAALLSVFVSRLIAAPLSHIGLVAARFANGSYDARVSEREIFCTRETANLAAQFNTMADEVNRSWQAQRESEERFREFAQIAADWFWETDLQQVFTYISPPSATDRRWIPGGILRQHRRTHIVGDPEDKVVTLIQSYMDREAPFDNIEYQVLGADGRTVYMSVAGRPMRDAAGVLVGYRGVGTDITERLYTQAQLRQAQQEEQTRHAQKLEAIGTLAGGIAHDFNNILSAIVGYTDLTLHECSPHTRIWRNLQEVLIAGKRAKELVQQILTFSRNSDQQRQPLHLHLVVKEALKLLRASLPATITIYQDIAEDIGAVHADPTQMHQVLMNLCANAEYAMRQTGGLLMVRLDGMEVDEALATQHPALRPGLYVRLTVQDTGPGIAPEILERIFEPFFTTKEVGQGSGMGLAVVHGIINSHNGAIMVESVLGKGTTFAIYLPWINATGVEETLPEEVTPNGKGTILFVDDENALAVWGQEILQHLGYDAVACTDSTQALEIFRRTPHGFDLVITDQTMPYMTGEVLAREMRQIRPDIPIILCTGFSHTIDAERARAQGINAFLMKPLTACELGRTIQRVLTQQTIQQVGQEDIS
jgi:PAS domain S-box-containing protein